MRPSERCAASPSAPAIGRLPDRIEAPRLLIEVLHAAGRIDQHVDEGWTATSCSETPFKALRMPPPARVAAWSMRRKDMSTRRICASMCCRDAPIARSASARPRFSGSVAASIMMVICSPVVTC